ncbi:MAG: prepilin-type N-terminal cleavage/methylation domain-containing protein [Candidatus Omnitrophota bacterium]
MITRKGFTLIELLIVVAIIGILAAIAVPNFLNARTRALVARCYSDMRAISMAFDMYNLDNNAFPFFGGTKWNSNIIFPHLTTPVAYMSAIPLDPFVVKDDPQRPADHGHYYPTWNVYEVVKAGWSWGGPPVVNAVKSGARMLSVSSGPDKKEDIASQATGLFAYKASNGLISGGDIYRFTPGSQGDSD